MKLALTGGGSGGHTLPAVTIYDSFVEKYSNQDEAFQCIYLGSFDGIEKDVADKKNIPYYSISTGKLRRYFSLKNFTDSFRILKGIWDAFFVLRKFKPDAVFSTGGFVSVPVVISAKLLSIPAIIHEQTSHVGLANKIASYFAKKVCCTFENSKKYFPPNKVIQTGQPIRKELFTGTKEEAYKLFDLDSNLPLIYITGGSQGSHKINKAIQEILKDLLQHSNIIHQCGKTQGHSDSKDLEEYKKTLSDELNQRYIVKDFIFADELKHILNASSLLVGRAGAGTVSEALALRLPSIFIPLAIAQRNEQYHNAKNLADLGGAEIILEADLNSETLKSSIIKIITDKEELSKMKQSMESSSIQNASDLIIELILNEINK